MSAKLSRAGLARALATFWLVGAAASALAQGGPPMVTDDPDTPGAGKWEINIGAIGSRTRGHREIAAPDADINYGWGPNVQLKLDVPWVTARDDGQKWKSGLGTGEVGVKWRFVDEEQAGFAVSTYPQLSRRILQSSTRRDLAIQGHEFFLPLEVSTEVGGFGLDAEVGREFVSRGKNAWVAGIIGAHGCGEELECIVEVRQSRLTGQHETLLNFGFHWKIDDSLTLLGAAGHEFGTRSDDRQQALVYLGLQFTR